MDCNYLVGKYPNGSSSNAILGPYLTGSFTVSCSSVSSSSGTQLQWSALWVKINFTSQNALNVLTTNLNANVNNIWSNIATLTYPFGLAGPTGTGASKC
jgi:hypothetical protein